MIYLIFTFSRGPKRGFIFIFTDPQFFGINLFLKIHRINLCKSPIATLDINNLLQNSRLFAIIWKTNDYSKKLFEQIMFVLIVATT